MAVVAEVAEDEPGAETAVLLLRRDGVDARRREGVVVRVVRRMNGVRPVAPGSEKRTFFFEPLLGVLTCDCDGGGGGSC